METVKVIKNSQTNEIFTKNEGVGKDGKQYGFILVSELNPRQDFESGVVRVLAPRTTAIAFSEESWEKVKHLYTEGKLIPGKIIFEESTEQKGNTKALINPKTEAVLTSGGNPIYRYYKFTQDSSRGDVKLNRDSVSAPVMAGASAESGALS
jgi:hypothetical protein